jgi:DNA repair protein RadA/Sms
VIAPSDLAAFGEIGLAGEVRPVPRAEARLAETGRMGMARVVSGHQDAVVPEGLRHLRARYLTEAIEILESSGSTG